MKTNLREITTASFIEDKAVSLSPGQRGWGYIFAAIGSVLFSMKAIFIKLAYMPSVGFEENQLDAITLLALRMGFSVPVYLLIGAWIIRRRKLAGEELPPKTLFLKAAGLGLMGYYLCSFMDFEGLKLITAQLERLLLFTYPVFVMILGALFFGHKITRNGVVSILIAYMGIVVIFAGGEIATGLNVPLGTALILGCAFLFSLFQLFAKSQINKMGSSLFTCAAMTASGTMVFMHFLMTNFINGDVMQSLTLPPRIWMLGAAIAVCSTLIPSFLINIALGRIGAQAVAMLGMISPIATIVFAIIWLGEPFGWVDAVGTGLTIFGIGLYTYLDRRTKLRPSNPNLATHK